MAATKLATDAWNETYKDVHRIIDRMVRKFIYRYGGDFEELRSQANLLFIEASQKWDRRRADFRCYLCYYIGKQLLEDLRVACTRNNRIRRNDVEVETLPRRSEVKFDVAEWSKTLSQDAATVAMLLFETPMDIRMSLIERGERGQPDSPGAFRLAIKEYLQDLGWTAHAVARAFVEIKNAL